MNITQFPQPEQNTARAHVAAEVRGHLAKRNIPAYKLSEVLGSTQSRGYWQRRVSGELSFDIDDLDALAGLLGVRITDFFTGHDDTPNPRRLVPKVAGSTPVGGTIVSFPRVERASPDRAGIAPITPLFGRVS